MAEGQTTVLDLSDATLGIVFSHLSGQQLGQVACVHPHWRSVSAREELWKEKLQLEYVLDERVLPSGSPVDTYRAAFVAWHQYLRDMQGPSLRRMLRGWHSILRWAAENFTEMLPTLNPGLTRAQLVQLEQEYDQELPESLRILYRLVNGQRVRTFLEQMLQAPFHDPAHPQPSQQHHQQHHHQQQQQPGQQEEGEPAAAAAQEGPLPPNNTLLLGMFGGYAFYHHLVNMRLLPLTTAFKLTHRLRQEAALSPQLLVVACSVHPRARLLLVDTSSGAVFISGLPLTPFPAAPQGEGEGEEGVAPFVRWFEEYGRRLEAGWYEACDMVDDAPPDMPTRAINLFPMGHPQMRVAVTRGVQVRVSNVFVPERSRSGQYWFSYCVRFSLLTPEQEAETVQKLAQLPAQPPPQQQQQQQGEAAAAAPTAAAAAPAGPDAGSGMPGVGPYHTRLGVTGVTGHGAASARPLASCQLLSRRWVQRDSRGYPTGEPVIGEGVIGKYPILVPGAPEFVYASCTSADGDGQSMEGGFTFVEGSIMQPAGPRFEVECPQFQLQLPEYIY